MPLARRKLEQRRDWALPSFLALLTDQPPGEIVHACRRHVAQRAEIDIARRLAARALDLQPWEAAVDGLIDGRRRIDGAAIRAYPFIPALTGEVVGLPDQRLALTPPFRRPLGEYLRHGSRFRKLLCQRLAFAAGDRWIMMLRSHPASERAAPLRATAALVGGPATAGLGRLVRLCSMSAFRPIATKQRTSPEVSNVPVPDSCAATRSRTLRHLRAAPQGTGGADIRTLCDGRHSRATALVPNCATGALAADQSGPVASVQNQGEAQ